MMYFLLIVGFILLIKGANWFVDGASKIANLLQVPPIIIGLTIVAFGTGAPEATISIIAALEGSAEVTLGNVVGSNILNISLVVGITAFIFPLKVESATIRKEIPFTFLSGVVLLVLISDIYLQYTNVNVITRSDGIIFLLFFSIFMYYIFEVARKTRDKTLEENPLIDKAKGTWAKNIIFTFIGLVAIVIGGYFVVENSREIAYMFGMSETLVGLTIVAIGSSLPELVTSVVAALKKQSEIALGNIVGSSIFNVFFVLGASSLIIPLPVDSKIFFDVFVLIGLTIVLFIFAITKCKVSKLEGVALSITYIAYFVFILIRN